MCQLNIPMGRKITDIKIEEDRIRSEQEIRRIGAVKLTDKELDDLVNVVTGFGGSSVHSLVLKMLAASSWLEATEIHRIWCPRTTHYNEDAFCIESKQKLKNLLSNYYG